MGELTKRDKQVLGSSMAVLLFAGVGALAVSGDDDTQATAGRQRSAIADAQLGAARNNAAPGTDPEPVAVTVVPFPRSPAVSGSPEDATAGSAAGMVPAIRPAAPQMVTTGNEVILPGTWPATVRPAAPAGPANPAVPAPPTTPAVPAIPAPIPTPPATQTPPATRPPVTRPPVTHTPRPPQVPPTSVTPAPEPTTPAPTTPAPTTPGPTTPATEPAQEPTTQVPPPSPDAPTAGPTSEAPATSDPGPAAGETTDAPWPPLPTGLPTELPTALPALVSAG